jgi:halimadienyl-diphosphate synthase
MTENIVPLIRQLLKEIGPGRMSTTAYDTAWIARLGKIDLELSSRALNWLHENQLPDGSWGSSEPFYYHDRLISTLAAMIALTYCGERGHDHKQMERGMSALERIIEDSQKGLQADPNGATVGFEMIAPTLVAEAKKLGIIKCQGTRVLDQLSHQRAAKLALIRGKMINRDMSAAFSAEMAGQDGHHMLDLNNLQGSNGSIGHSPSATAYFALYVKPQDSAALTYLRKIINSDGGAPDLVPIDVFEAAWNLWNLSLFESWDQETILLFNPLVKYLKQGWEKGKGIGLSVDYCIPDGDDTTIAFEALTRLGCHPDVEAVLSFEENQNFRTYHYEADISVSVNIHALGALRQAGFAPTSFNIQKILAFLKKTKVGDTYWLDKWHLSPYYTTSHAIVASAGYANDLIEKSIEWIISSQNPDGSWGYGIPTAEETAYCLQSLCIWKRRGGTVPRRTLQNARSWLSEHIEPPYPYLWIGKGLYTVELVVRSAIYSALLLAQES